MYHPETISVLSFCNSDYIHMSKTHEQRVEDHTLRSVCTTKIKQIGGTSSAPAWIGHIVWSRVALWCTVLFLSSFFCILKVTARQSAPSSSKLLWLMTLPSCIHLKFLSTNIFVLPSSAFGTFKYSLDLIANKKPSLTNCPTANWLSD